MKYNININQRTVVEQQLSLDVVDMSIFNYLEGYALSGNTERILFENRLYFWVSHTKIISDMPMLGINTRQGILKRIDKLIEARLIDRHPDSKRLQKSYYCFGVNFDQINGSDLTTNVVTTRQRMLSPPDNDCCHDNSIRDNSIRDTNLKPDFSKSVSQPSLFDVETEIKIPTSAELWEAYEKMFLTQFNLARNSKCKIVDQKTSKQLKALMNKGVAIPEIINALKNAMTDKHHIDSSFKYLTMEFITRADKFNRFSQNQGTTLSDTDYE